MTIPYLFQPVKLPKMTKEEVDGALSGKYRFRPEQFAEVVRSCPGVESEVKEWVIATVNECATKPDGSIDVFLSGFIMGKLMRTVAVNPQVMAISEWIKNLDRLPFYIVEDEDEPSLRG